MVSGIEWGALLISAGKVVVSSLAMLAALHWIGALGVTPEATLASRGWFLFGQIAIGGTVFVAVARVLNVEELGLGVAHDRREVRAQSGQPAGESRSADRLAYGNPHGPLSEANQGRRASNC